MNLSIPLLLRSVIVAIRITALLFYRIGFGFGLLVGKHDLIGKAQLHSLLGVEPGLVGHKLGDFVSGEPGLRHIGVEDALFDLVQRGDRLLHRSGIPHGNRHGIMNHDHSHRRDQHSVTCHCHNRCGTGRDSVNLHGNGAGVIPDHGVYLGSGEHIPTRTINPDGHVTIFCVQFLSELLRRHAIRPERLLVNRPFKPEDTATAVIPYPRPELVHCQHLHYLSARLG